MNEVKTDMKCKTFLELAYETLKKVQAPLTDRQIWEKSQELDIKIDSEGKTPWKTIGARIYVDMKDNAESKFVRVGKRPALFYIKEMEINKSSEKKAEQELEHFAKGDTDFCEKDLHALLVYFLNVSPHFNCVSKTIDEKVSHKGRKGENEWLHPDLVGVHFPYGDYDEQTLKFISALNFNEYALFSFEIKKSITFSTLRQYYFQAVSNSSWANEGYLVALDYETDSDFVEEMHRLANSFGIGFIQLNAENVEQSEILIQAKRKEELDWDTINRLVENNKDFKELLKSVVEDIQAKRIHASEYDKIFSEEEMKQYIERKKILVRKNGKF